MKDTKHLETKVLTAIHNANNTRSALDRATLVMHKFEGELKKVKAEAKELSDMFEEAQRRTNNTFALGFAQTLYDQIANLSEAENIKHGGSSKDPQLLQDIVYLLAEQALSRKQFLDLAEGNAGLFMANYAKENPTTLQNLEMAQNS